MTYLELAYLHLSTISPAFLIGAYLLLNSKGTAMHRLLGKVYMGLMLFTALVTLFMAAEVGPTLFHHFGLIHVFSVYVLLAVPVAYWAVRRGHIKQHKRYMVGLYVGGILIAGGFTLVPGRLLHTWLFT